MAPVPKIAVQSGKLEDMDEFRASFAIWTTTETKSSKPKPNDQIPPKDDAQEPNVEEDKASEAGSMVTKDDAQEPHFEDEKSVGTASTVKGNSPSVSPETSPSAKENGPKILPLSTANLIRITEREEYDLLSCVGNSYNLSDDEMREVIFVKKMKKWLEEANPDGRQEDTASESYRSGDWEIQGGTEIAVEDVVQQHTGAASSNPHLMERNLRVDAAKDRVSILKCRNSIRPGYFLFLRHAMHIDAEGLAGVVNSYVRCSAHTLESKPVTTEEIIQRIDESRQQELPFIVAIKQHEENDFDSRRPWGRILGFARLTNFLGGQPAVASAAQLEIMVAQNSKGQKVGRCLMDALMTIADPKYSPKGGYPYVSNIPNETMINCASWSCRPLCRIVVMMSYFMIEKSVSDMIKEWLKREHKFKERGYLPSIAQKMNQEVGITVLVRTF